MVPHQLWATHSEMAYSEQCVVRDRVGARCHFEMLTHWQSTDVLQFLNWSVKEACGASVYLKPYKIDVI